VLGRRCSNIKRDWNKFTLPRERRNIHDHNLMSIRELAALKQIFDTQNSDRYVQLIDVVFSPKQNTFTI
jgi:hypothetical protein